MTRTVLDKEVRRSQLIDAAIKVFARKGYQSASITDIIEAAGVARGTFYLYFDSKLDVFHAVMDLHLDQFKDVVKRELTRPFGNPLNARGRIKESLLEWLRFYNDNKDLSKVVFRQAMAIEPEYEKRCNEMLESCFQHWNETIVKFQKAGFVRKDLEPEFLNTAFSGMMVFIVLRYLIPNPKPDLEKIADQWLDFIEHGVKAKGWLG